MGRVYSANKFSGFAAVTNCSRQRLAHIRRRMHGFKRLGLYEQIGFPWSSMCG